MFLPTSNLTIVVLLKKKLGLFYRISEHFSDRFFDVDIYFS